MAMNPMQRRARNSFLIGFLVALIIMAIVVLFLLQRMKAINEAKEALEQLQKSVYVAMDDLESGQIVTLDEDFIMEKVQSTVDTNEIISPDDFVLTDEDGNILLNEDDEEISKEIMMKINVPKGTIVTKDMIVATDEQTSDSERLAEYNMILLPSHLKNGDYIDIRLSLPSGQDYIVISKQKVFGTTSQAVWLKLDEEEILTLNNAIVESYIIQGSKLYALPYTESGMQLAATTTYVPSQDVVRMINDSPNITNEAKNSLASKLNLMSTVRAEQIAPALSKAEENGVVAGSAVEAGVSEETEKIKAARQEYVSELEGTDDIGYSR